MKVLAIDSSNLTMGVAVVEDERVLGECITNIKMNHSVRLMPAIERLLIDTQLKPVDIDRIVVAEGPGSYTGVRIGVTVAKTMAWTLKKELVGVSSLEILAQNGKFFDGVIVPLFDARRGQVYTGLFEAKNGQVKREGSDQIILLETWLKDLVTLNKTVLFLGLDVGKHIDLIKEIMKEKAVFIDGPQTGPRPSELAFIGSHRAPIAQIHEFSPRYLQLAEAEAKWLANQKGEITMEESIQIRQMTIDDVDKVVHVENSSFATPWTREAFVNEMRTNRFATYFVAEVNDFIIGYCGVWVILDEAHITNIAVLQEYRGYKIGETLLKKAMVYAEMKRAKSMSLEVRVSNEIAQNLYRKLGFQNGGIRKRYYSDNQEDALVMWVKL